MIAADGWQAQPTRILITDKKGKTRDKGWTCDLVPKQLIVDRYFIDFQEGIIDLEAKLETVTARMTELEEEHGGDEGAFSELDKVNKANVTARLKEIKGDKEAKAEAAVLNEWLKLNTTESDLKKQIKEAETELDARAYAKYATLTEADVKTLVVEDKWLATLETAIQGEMDRISQAIAKRIKELAERYETPLPRINDKVGELEGKVGKHLARMGFGPVIFSS